MDAWWWEAKSQKDVVIQALVSFSVIIISWYIWKVIHWNSKLPPGPQGLPIVGNLPFVHPELHRYFAKLSNTYGPIIKVKLCSNLVVVLSSPEFAQVVLKEFDSTFANRYPTVAGAIMSHGGSDISFANGVQWRNVRSFCVREFLSKETLNSFSTLRQQEIRRTLRSLYAKVNTPVYIRQEMHLTMLNVIMNMLWGGTFNDEDKIRFGLEFGRVAEQVVEYVGKTNISDFFPILARLDLQGVERRMKELVSWLDSFFSSIIEQRMKKNHGDQDGKNEFKDILQTFLKLQDQGDFRTPFTITNLKALFTDLVVVGTDTSGVTVEWVMAELLKHPKIMKNAQEELENVVGRNNNVEESHISRLPYLGAILKETLRLNPVGPLLASRCPSSSCSVGGYVIPKGAQVFVNAWAIQRDPKYWDNPLEFKPERFLHGTNNKADFIGNDFQYIPFGSGRRRCVGVPLAERMVPYALASLLHLFEWRLPEGEEIDLSDKFGIVLKKSTPLHAIPFPRLSDPSLYV